MIASHSNEIHEPKLRALLALHAGVLSTRSRARVERHLEGCDACRQSLAEVRLYATVLDDVRKLEAPSIDWSRMDLALRREARDQARAIRWPRVGPMVGIVLVAAATILAFLLSRSDSPDEIAAPEAIPIPSSPSDNEAEPIERALPIRGVVMAVVGEVTRANGEAIQVGAEITEGDTVTTAEAARMHVRLEAGSGIVVGSNSTVALTRLRAGDIELSLAQGSVANEVRVLNVDEQYVVEAGELSVHVQGTRFEVRRQGARVAVTLDEGRVSVRRGGETLHGLEAPATWSSAPSEYEPSAVGAVPAVRGLAEGAAGWPMLTLPALEYVEYWEVDGTELGAFAEARLLVPVGTLRVVGHGPDGSIYESEVEMLEEGLVLTEESLHPPRPERREGYLSQEDIQPVIQRGAASLRRCYNRTLRNHPEVEGEISLRLYVTGNGQVRRVQVRTRGAEPPEDLTTCISEVTEQWQFPAPVGGGPVTLHLPLVFAIDR